MPRAWPLSFSNTSSRWNLTNLSTLIIAQETKTKEAIRKEIKNNEEDPHVLTLTILVY